MILDLVERGNRVWTTRPGNPRRSSPKRDDRATPGRIGCDAGDDAWRVLPRATVAGRGAWGSSCGWPWDGRDAGYAMEPDPARRSGGNGIAVHVARHAAARDTAAVSPVIRPETRKWGPHDIIDHRVMSAGLAFGWPAESSSQRCRLPCAIERGHHGWSRGCRSILRTEVGDLQRRAGWAFLEEPRQDDPPSERWMAARRDRRASGVCGTRVSS